MRTSRVTGRRSFFAMSIVRSLMSSFGIAKNSYRPSAASTPPTRSRVLFLEFQAAGVTFFQTLKLMPWGARNFIVKDPDGNLVLFAGPGS